MAVIENGLTKEQQEKLLNALGILQENPYLLTMDNADKVEDLIREVLGIEGRNEEPASD